MIVLKYVQQKYTIGRLLNLAETLMYFGEET